MAIDNCLELLEKNRFSLTTAFLNVLAL